MELNYAYGTAAVMVIYFLGQVISKRFDPFAPVWLFFVGYVQVYVVQAISYHDWALQARGVDLVTAANLRAFWALLWFLFIYHFGPGNLFSSVLPRPPQNWSSGTIAVISPPLVIWGLVCAGLLLRSGPEDATEMSAEASLLRSFPFVMLVAANLLIITGRAGGQTRPKYLWAGVACAGLYILIWMFNGKRSHSLIGVLSSICSFYISKLKRPSWAVLFTTAFCGIFAVAIAISWRYDRIHERSASGFLEFLADFDPQSALRNFNIDTEEDPTRKYVTKETEEYGGFLLMMDVVPFRSDYDYGVNYLRIFSTFIPRIVWPDKPIFGREQWVKAWIAGSEMKRTMEFSGPAISILGATQLNGGMWGTLIVIACAATLQRTTYCYFRRYANVPWAQAFWAISYYNAWFMVVNDDPLIWFYYNYGFTTMPILVFLWVVNKLMPQTEVTPPHYEDDQIRSTSEGSAYLTA